MDNEVRNVKDMAADTFRGAVRSLHPGHVESDFQRAVITYAESQGWRVHTERPAMTNRGYVTPVQGSPGWPDLVLAKLTRPVIFVELKTNTGRLDNEQVIWLDVLNGLGSLATVWRPRDTEKIIYTLESAS